MSINHKRLDEILDMSFDLDCHPGVADEFEALRQLGPKLSGSQARRMNHLEKHLDAGDRTCDCYEALSDVEQRR